MASFVPHEGSSVRTALVGKGESRSYSAIAASGLSAPSLLRLHSPRSREKTREASFLGLRGGTRLLKSGSLLACSSSATALQGLRTVSQGDSLPYPLERPLPGT